MADDRIAFFFTDAPARHEETWRQGYRHGQDSDQPKTEDLIYISGWLHGYAEGNDCDHEHTLMNYDLLRPIKDYDDLKSRLEIGDPLVDKERPDEVVQQEDGLFIKGINANGRFADDLLITLEGPSRLILRYRHPEMGKNPCHEELGERKWSDPCTFETYCDLAGFVYEL